MRVLVLDLPEKCVWVRFNYDAELVNLVKTIPGRQWDQKNRQWRVPLSKLPDLMRLFSDHQFSYSSELRDYLEDNPEEESTEEEEEQTLAFSVSELNLHAQEMLREGFSAALYLDGEVSGLARNKKVGHAYFELIDRRKGVVLAKINAICFAKVRSRISGRLARVGKRIQDGEKYRFIVKPELYTKQGQFQVIIQDIEMEAIFSTAKRQRDEVIGQLKKEKILEDNLNKEMPLCPLHIGLISALDSDAYNDFVHELERSDYRFRVHFLNAKMQGVDAALSLSSAIEKFQKIDVDIIAIVRGGGAKSSLADLDAIEVGRAVCVSRTKILCGIGHHRDRGVLDEVCLSEKTPTAAAQLLVKKVQSYAQNLRDIEEKIAYYSKQRLEKEDAYVKKIGLHLEKNVLENTRSTEMDLEALAKTIPQSARYYLRASNGRIQAGSEDLGVLWTTQLSRSHRNLDRERLRLESLPIDRKLANAHMQITRLQSDLAKRSTGKLHALERAIAHLEKQLEWMKPEQTLKRGYALLRKNDTIIKRVEGLKPGDRLDAFLYDGQIQLSLISINMRGEGKKEEKNGKE